MMKDIGVLRQQLEQILSSYMQMKNGEQQAASGVRFEPGAAVGPLSRQRTPGVLRCNIVG